MKVSEFISKWKKSNLKESAAAQEHFIDLCNILEHPTPGAVDPDGTWFTFEYGAQKTTGKNGFADVWKKGYFGWEYKGKRKDLQTAYSQLQQYAPALANPPLLVVCDTDRFEIYTNWNDYVSEKHIILLEDLIDPIKLNVLRSVFNNPEALKPKKSRQHLTQEIAGNFTQVAERLRQRNHDPQKVAHFINRLIFCMFAEDVELLPKGLFTNLIKKGIENPDDFERKLGSLFKAMNKGGQWGADDILWFNGGLFDNDETLKLDAIEINLVYDAAQKDWSDVDPSIMGTLFERLLDPNKLNWGVHYTDREMIMKIIDPVIVQPLAQEWENTKSQIIAELKKAETQRLKANTSETAAQATKAENRAIKIYNSFKSRIIKFKILDPACGSGNFLYLSLKALKDIEQQVNIFGELTFGLTQSIPEIGPQNIFGIEINTYAAELASISVWIGEIQWIKKHGFNVPAKPVLKKLNNIVCHDALMNEDGTEYNWPQVDVVVGNPPFVGDKKMIGELGDEYTNKVRKQYESRVSGGADFVCFWFAKCIDYMQSGWLKRAGLVSTNSIRGGKNRLLLDKIAKFFAIYDAWADEEWINEGASVRVSMTCFSATSMEKKMISGEPVKDISSDLTEKKENSKIDVSKVKQLKCNRSTSFIGTQKSGNFDIPGELAREWLAAPNNPNNRPNSEVLKPWINGIDITRRPQGKWIVDFPEEMSEKDASLYEMPFEFVKQNVKLEIELKQQKWLKEGKPTKHLDKQHENWWVLWCYRREMRLALKGLKRYLSTARNGKHRIFQWQPAQVLADSQVVVIAKENDIYFGILSSKYHEIWSLKLCTWLGKGNDPRYNPKTIFETFPFPRGLEPNRSSNELDSSNIAQKISLAARNLNELRENWINPTELINAFPEIIGGYPNRIVPKDKTAEKILSKRTLTNLYNQKPTWLCNAHKELDNAVAEAYGWPDNLTDDEILEKLFELNQKGS